MTKKIDLMLKNFTDQEYEIFTEAYEIIFPDKYNFYIDTSNTTWGANSLTPLTVKAHYYNRVVENRKYSTFEFKLIDLLFSNDLETIYIASNFILKNAVASQVYHHEDIYSEKFHKLSFAYIEYIKYIGVNTIKDKIFRNFNSAICNFYFQFISRSTNYYSNPHVYNNNIYLEKVWKHFNEHIYSEYGNK